MTTLRLAAILLAAALCALYLRPADFPDEAPDSEIRATGPPPGSERPSAAAEPTAPLPAARPGTQGKPVAGSPAAAPLLRSRVHGLVRNAHGIPLEGIEIVAGTHTANGIELARSSAVSDYRGEFVLEQLLPGRQYSLAITPRDDQVAYDLEPFIAGRTERLQDIVLRHVPMVDVDGMVVDVDRSPVADFEFTVGSLSIEFPPRVVKSDSTGFFSLHDFPAGEIRIATKASDYYRIQGLELRPDVYHNLILIIDRGSHHLAGWVSDAIADRTKSEGEGSLDEVMESGKGYGEAARQGIERLIEESTQKSE